MSGCSDCGCAFGRAGSLQRRLGLLQSPSSAPAQPCHHCSHFFPQQGGGAPVPEQGLLCSQDLNRGCWILGKVGQTAGVGDQTCSNLEIRQSVMAPLSKNKNKSQFWHWMHNTVWGPSAPNTFFITLAQWIDRFWYNIIGPCVGVKNKTSTHHFSNQGCQVWSHLAHLRPQILLQLQPVGSQRHDTTRKPLDVNQVNGRYIHTWRPNNQRMISIIFLAGAAFVTFKPVHGMKREIVSPDRIRSEDACLHYRFMRELLYPPVLDTKDTCSPEWAKKGHNVEYVDEPESSWHKLTLDMDEINFDPSGMCICEIMQHILWMCGVLTHRGAWCIQDGLSLGTVHHHLL